MPTTFSVDFSGDSDASAGGAGTTTGAGHGIIDVDGGVASRESGNLIITGTGRVLLPIDENSEQSAQITVLGGSEASQIIHIRGNPGITEPNQPVSYALEFTATETMPWAGGSGFWGLYRVEESTAHVALNTPDVGGLVKSIPALIFANTHSATIEAVGANPTTLNVTIRDETDGVDRVTFSTTDSSDTNESSLQGDGAIWLRSYDLSGYGGPATAKIRTIDATSEAGNALVAGAPSLDSNTGSAITVSVSPTGGVEPYSYQWYKKKDSADWTPGPATLISGATSSTYSDTDANPGELWFYRCAVTDSAAQSQNSSFLLVEGHYSESIPATREFLNGIIIVTIGDSITAAEPGAGGAMVTQLEGEGLTVYRSNQGRSGSQLVLDWDTETDPEGYISDAVSATEALQAAHPGAALIWSVMLGTNDARDATPTTAEEFSAALENLRALCVSLGGVMVVHGAPWIQIGESFSVADLLISYRNAANDLADGETLFSGDQHAFYSFYLNIPGWYSDLVHPNSTGDTALGGLWATSLLRTVLAEIELHPVSAGGGRPMWPLSAPRESHILHHLSLIDVGSTGLPKPQNLVVVPSDYDFTASFDAVPGADEYEWKLDGGSWTSIGTDLDFSGSGDLDAHKVRVRGLAASVPGQIKVSPSFILGVAPQNSVEPHFTSDTTPDVGDTITLNLGSFSDMPLDKPVHFNVRWYADDVLFLSTEVPGASATTTLAAPSYPDGTVITADVAGVNIAGSLTPVPADNSVTIQNPDTSGLMFSPPDDPMFTPSGNLMFA